VAFTTDIIRKKDIRKELIKGYEKEKYPQMYLDVLPTIKEE
jgi:glutaredoxin-related protein